ncbi:MAG: hypothetical protein J0I06_14450 [Planctomycetes bacterium]|nr:hypothetical protein [Planctomycetota bacterium]
MSRCRRPAPNPEKAVPFLKERVPIGPDAGTLKKLFADLGSDNFAARERATKALSGYGESARVAMEAELARSESPAVRGRLAERLKQSELPAAPALERLRLIRAVEVVEGIGTPEAKALLEVWAASPRCAARGRGEGRTRSGQVIPLPGSHDLPVLQPPHGLRPAWCGPITP